MKHFVVKVLVVVAVGLFALSRLQAQQDTAITIYGKRFAPGVEVYLDGQKISNVVRDSAQPSRILRVKIPFSLLLQAPVTVAGVKNGGASLTSTTITHILRVINPGPNQHGIDSTITITKAPPSVVLKTLDGKIIGSPELPILRMFALVGKDTTLTLKLEYSGLEIGSKIRFSLKIENGTSPFKILNTKGQDINGDTIFLQGKNGSLNIRVKFTEDTGILTDSLYLELNEKRYRALRLEGIRQIKILAAYTNNCLNPFFRIGDQLTTSENPVLYMEKKLQTLNEYIAAREPTTSSMYFTRFIFAEPPLLVEYQEPSILNKELHTDIAALQIIPEIQAKLMSDNTIQNVILLVNSDEAMYRAIASECSASGLPKYIVVEIKYGDTFIDPFISVPVPIEEPFLADLRAAIR